MLKSDIKRAEALLARKGSSRDEDRLILAVKASAQAASAYKDILKEALRHEYDESEIKRLGRGGDMVVGFLISASSIANDSRLFPADLAGLLVDAKGDVVGWRLAYDLVSRKIRPEDITLRGAAVLEDNLKVSQDILASKNLRRQLDPLTNLAVVLATLDIHSDVRKGGDSYSARRKVLKALFPDPDRFRRLGDAVVKNFSLMLGKDVGRLNNPEVDAYDNNLFAFYVDSWHDLKTALDVIEKNDTGSRSDITEVDVGVPYMVARDFQFYPAGFRGVMYGDGPGATGTWKEWLKMHKPAATARKNPVRRR